MKFVLPRVVLGNRGDITSRWGIIKGLVSLGLKDVSVFADSPGNVPDAPYSLYAYGKLHNLLLTREGRKALKDSDTVIWAGGHDLQDDLPVSSVNFPVSHSEQLTVL